MKKQAARTITILSLFVMLSVGTSNFSAFAAGGCGVCKPAAHYAAVPALTTNSVPVQIASAAPAQDTMAVDVQSAGAGSFVFLVELALFFASLL